MTPQGQPPNPFVGVLIQFWWLIPVAILISAVGGIWFERFRRRREPNNVPADHLPVDARNVTVVKNLKGGVSSGLSEHDYAARLPEALEKKYPNAEYIAEGGVSRVFQGT